jgi:hypothetical protein
MSDDNVSGYRMIAPNHVQIGWLKMPTFHCMDCGPIQNETDAKVYEVNIRPYSQTCHKCGKLVIDGVKNQGVPTNLFPKQEDSQ